MTGLQTIRHYIRNCSMNTIYEHIRNGIIAEDIGDVLMDTNAMVKRDFITLLHIPKERRNEYIVKLAQEIYLQWCEHGIIQDSVIVTVDEYAYQDEWRNDGREIGDTK